MLKVPNVLHLVAILNNLDKQVIINLYYRQRREAAEAKGILAYLRPARAVAPKLGVVTQTRVVWTWNITIVVLCNNWQICFSPKFFPIKRKAAFYKNVKQSWMANPRQDWARAQRGLKPWKMASTCGHFKSTAIISRNLTWPPTGPGKESLLALETVRSGWNERGRNRLGCNKAGKWVVSAAVLLPISFRPSRLWFAFSGHLDLHQPIPWQRFEKTHSSTRGLPSY